MDKTCDTNVVQSLYILLHRPDKCAVLDRTYKTLDRMNLHKLAEQIARGTKVNLYVTPMVMKEVEECEAKYPGIVQFAREHFKIKAVTSPHLIQVILELEEEYLKQDVTLNDSTRQPLSAIEEEIKDGMPSRADAHIVAENTVLYGQPLFSLNEKHLICYKMSRKPNSPQRSSVILKKNQLVLERGARIHKMAKKNLKKITSTTFKVKNIHKSKEELISSMLQEL